jgi:hypothetical protein
LLLFENLFLKNLFRFSVFSGAKIGYFLLPPNFSEKN